MGRVATGDPSRQRALVQAGLRELIVGHGAQSQFKGLDVGSHIALRGSDWTIVGSFESNGDSHESELLADAETVLSAYRRNLYQSVIVLLDSQASFDAFKTALTTNPQLSVDVQRERDYYAHQSERMTNVLSFVAYVVGGIMAVGALFGALNTMYSAVSVRTREIATLRAIGFGAAAVVLSVLIEAMLLSILGALIGAGLAWVFFNGNVVSTLGSNFTQVVFRLAVSPALVVLGVLWACVIGLIGGLFPAIRAARLPVATALRAV
jgi:putative ABC transport system permease protein